MGSDWQRQRKLTATPFNEQKSRIVWVEAMRQANDMLQSWISYDVNGLNCTSDDTRTLTLHVLAYAAFQKSYPFESITREHAIYQPLTYRDSLSIILKNALVIMVMPVKAFDIPFLPAKWTRIGKAVADFRGYMLTQLADEKRLIAEGKPGSGTLMSNLVRASNEVSQARKVTQKLDGPEEASELKTLTTDEILGNIFVYNFAGHDTTAGSLAYSMLLLVAHPKVQEWIAEELDFFLETEDRESWTYEEVFPKLQRCLAVLVRQPERSKPIRSYFREAKLTLKQLETLRLYNPLLGIIRYTGTQSTSLKVNEQTIQIPADTVVIPSLMALHAHPRYWGEDALVWRPSRWIEHASDSTSGDIGTRISRERLLVPEKGAYFAWSGGARGCPGKKFAQVEFVATMATLFRSHRVQPVPRKGETLDQARNRVLHVVKDTRMQLLLQMRDPNSVAVTWSRR